jgi:hypothetical protein
MKMAGKIKTRRGRLAVLTAGLAVSMIAAGGGSALAVTAGHPVAKPDLANAGQVSSLSSVPWRKVGTGWVLTEYWAGRAALEGTPKAGAATLYLVDPAGGRYRLYRWAATKNPPFVLDWSGDKTRALIQLEPSGKLEQLVLATGKISRIDVSSAVSAIGYTRPTGQNVLGWRPDGSKFRLDRYSLTGQLLKTLATGPNDNEAVYSDSGTTLAVGGTTGIQLVSNGGGVIRRLPVPKTSVAGCTPTRWWTASTILATCVARHAISGRLWLVPASGAKPTALTPQRSSHSADLGDIGAWRLPSGLYLQGLGACGTVQIFKQASNGSVKLVSIPGDNGDNNQILTARGSRLLVRAETGCPGNESLLWFTPSTRHVQWLFKTPSSVAGVLAAVPYGKPDNFF